MTLSSFVLTLIFFPSNVHANRRRSIVNIILAGVNPALFRYHLPLHYDLIFLVPTCDTECKRSIDRRTDDIVIHLKVMMALYSRLGLNFFGPTDNRSITCARTGDLSRYFYYINLCLRHDISWIQKFSSVHDDRRTDDNRSLIILQWWYYPALH